MAVIEESYLIKLAQDSLALLILREQIKQSETDLPPSFSRQRQLEQWISARNLLLEQT